jgi:hypothetical protein
VGGVFVMTADLPCNEFLIKIGEVPLVHRATTTLHMQLVQKSSCHGQQDNPQNRTLFDALHFKAISKAVAL